MKEKILDFITKGTNICGRTVSLVLTSANLIFVVVSSILSCVKLKKGWKIAGVLGSCGLSTVFAWLQSRWVFKRDCKNEGVYFKHFTYMDRIKWAIKGDDYLEECYEDPYED